MLVIFLCLCYNTNTMSSMAVMEVQTTKDLYVLT